MPSGRPPRPQLSGTVSPAHPVFLNGIPPIVIVALVLGGPERVRVVFHSSSRWKQRSGSHNISITFCSFSLHSPYHVPVKPVTPGEPGHTRDTHGTRGRTKAHGPRRRTSQPSKPTNNTHPARQRDDRSRGPTQQPQARSRPLPAADSEEATPSEPDPASTRSQSASPRACSKVEVGEMKARAADA